MAQAIFTRLKDGSWGVRVNTDVKPESGDRILINKKDGSVVNAVIADVQWFGQARDGRLAALVSIVKTPAKRWNRVFQSEKFDDHEGREIDSNENDYTSGW